CVVGIILIKALEAVFCAAAGESAATSRSACYDGPLGAVTFIEGGRYVMGSETHYPEERPAVEVWVDGFDIDRHEVTNAQFRRFVEETGYITSAERAREIGFDEDGSAVFSGGDWIFVPHANWRNPKGPGSTIAG